MEISDQKFVFSIIDGINKKLDNLEELIYWRIGADERFRKGQRVQFSAIADRRGMSKGRKGGVRKGRVTGIHGTSIEVLLDGYTRPKGFHHMFFDHALASQPVRVKLSFS